MQLHVRVSLHMAQNIFSSPCLWVAGKGKHLQQLIPNLRSQTAMQLCSQKHVQKAITGPFTDTTMP